MSHKAIFLDCGLFDWSVEIFDLFRNENKYWYEELYHTVAEGVEVLHRDIFSIEDNCYQDVYGMDCIFP